MLDTLLKVFVAVIPLLLLAFSWKVRPVWLKEEVAEEMRNRWSKILVQSTLITYLAGAATFFLVNTSYIASDGIILTPTILFPALVMLLTFPVLQAFYTDIKFRLVDRHILRLTFGLAVVLGMLSFIEIGWMPLIVSYLVFVAIASIIFYIPAIGDSDARAFQLLVATVFPIVMYDGLMLAMVGYIVAMGIYNLVIAIKNNDFPKGLFKKISMPMVPLILAPGVVVILGSLIALL